MKRPILNGCAIFSRGVFPANCGGDTRCRFGTVLTVKSSVRKILEEAQAAADKHYGRHVELTRETDVLDTWFSSGLWAFSTMGWPDKSDYLDTFYPTSVLVTGFDIIFFWVAR